MQNIYTGAGNFCKLVGPECINYLLKISAVTVFVIITMPG